MCRKYDLHFIPLIMIFVNSTTIIKCKCAIFMVNFISIYRAFLYYIQLFNDITFVSSQRILCVQYDLLFDTSYELSERERKSYYIIRIDFKCKKCIR